MTNLACCQVLLSKLLSPPCSCLLPRAAEEQDRRESARHRQDRQPASRARTLSRERALSQPAKTTLFSGLSSLAESWNIDKGTTILGLLKTQNGIEHFLEPVDHVVLEIPDYPKAPTPLSRFDGPVLPAI